MRRLVWPMGLVGLVAAIGVFALAAPARAQDYRARVQGTATDSSQSALPGATVTLLNEATGVAATTTTDDQGRYLFDFVEPGMYAVSASLNGFKAVELKNIRIQQRQTLTVDLPLEVGGVEERIIVEAAPVTVQFKSGSAELTLERQLIDQAPIPGRNPYNLSNVDPTIVVSPGTNENRPYHHAYANDYDAGGGTRRGNDVLLDGVPLVASYKTAYTPAVDAVEEITVSKTSVDAENGHSLGGIISLNMKSGTNEYHGSAYVYGRDPSMNSLTDPTIRITPGQNTRSLRGTELKMYGATFGFPIERNKIFSFTSFEQWDDLRPLSIVRTVPTEAERRGDFSQSVLNGRVRTIYNPFTSTVDPASRLVVRQPFEGNRIPSTLFDPAALKMLNEMPLPNQPGNVDNWQGSVYDSTDYWNLSQRVDVNITDDWKMFVRYGQFKANLYQQNPTDAGFFPLSGSNRYGLSIAADSVWVMSKKTTVNVRGSFYNMTDEFFNPSLLLGDSGLQDYWPGNSWYSSLYNSGYVYYPALDVTSGTGTGTGNRLGRQGREWYQHPDAWTISARMNRYQGRHTMKWGGEIRAYYGEAARFEPINLVFNSALTAHSSDTPDIVNSGNQWASFLIGALDGQTSARLVPLQTPRLMGYSAYVQDDFEINGRLTLNLGLRWEFEPGPTDPMNRLSQRFDLTQPIPEMQSAPPNIPVQARLLMASKGYDYRFNGAWVFASEDNPHAWNASARNFLPRVGVNYRLSDDSVARFAYARYMMPTINVRDTLGDFVNQYTGYAQTTNTLGLANGRPQQMLSNPYPANNPVIEPYDQAYGRYTGLGGTISLDEYELRPQINDRFNVSYQKQVWWGTTIDLSYFYNLGTRVPYTVNLNMADPNFRYEQRGVVNTQVDNPFFGYLTPDKFPGALRNNRQVTLGSLLVPYPQYGEINQTNTNGRQLRTHMVELRAQRPFAKGLSFLAAYAWNHERIQETLDDLARYRVLTTGGEDGWEWRPTDSPVHRFTTAVTWQVPIGRDRAFLSTLPTVVDYAIGGWQYTAAMRYYSGRPLFFGNFVVNGDPTLDEPTRDRWFDTSRFSVQDTFTPRSNPSFYQGLNGPAAFFADMTLTKSFRLGPRYRVEARIEAYNAFNTIVWDNPDLNLANANFGRVTRKRTDAQGREIQIGVRFAF